ncbi:hypothetical protein M413DRAFT_449778 [Hebeloma cylindrosporum]|uniref:Uncharacterized protein n=1 Tax=Hebeloma cylindrosporum TaxID=76867 RepID=A0A0C3BF39_HEBCY|nr:hypothetical protein M413DRAFT_449778 [Hebeloma cylindrosporum h7]
MQLLDFARHHPSQVHKYPGARRYFPLSNPDLYLPNSLRQPTTPTPSLRQQFDAPRTFNFSFYRGDAKVIQHRLCPPIVLSRITISSRL